MHSDAAQQLLCLVGIETEIRRNLLLYFDNEKKKWVVARSLPDGSEERLSETDLRQPALLFEQDWTNNRLRNGQPSS